VIDTDVRTHLNQAESGSSPGTPPPAPPAAPTGRTSSDPETDRGAVAFVWGAWALMLLAALWYVGRFGSAVIPISDEWDGIVPALVGQPVTFGWLWSQHNEHRVPLPRLLLLGVLKPTGDFRAVMVLDVAVLGAVSLWMILTAKRLRGRVSYCDAFFPLLLLNLAQFENFLIAWQITVVSSAALAGVLLCLIVRRGRLLNAWQATAAGVCLLLLPLCGAIGVALVPALAVWMAYLGVLAWRSSEPRQKPKVVLMLAFSAAALALVACYFVGLQKVAHHPTSAGIRRTLRACVEFISGGMGWVPATQLWPYLGVGLLGLTVISSLVAVWMFWARPPERVRALGLFLFLGAMASLTLGLAWGRNGFGPGAAVVPRYFTLAAPAFCALYFVWVLRSNAAGRFVQNLLFFLMCALLWNNITPALDWGRDLRKKTEAFERDLAAGASIDTLVERHVAVYTNAPWGREALRSRLYWLHEAGIKPYQSMRIGPLGAVTLADANRITGFAWDMRHSDSPQWVDVSADDVLLATVLADEVRPGLPNYGVGSHKCGFNLATPDALKDGKVHVVRVKISGAEQVLAEGVLLASPPGQDKAPANFGGFIDQVNEEGIVGWAWDSQTPDLPLTVEVYVDDTQLAPVSADQFRPDLRDAGIGDGRHAFTLPTSVLPKDGKPHAVRVKLPGTGATIVEKGVLTPR
jgi:hypothetical protein